MNKRRRRRRRLREGRRAPLIHSFGRYQKGIPLLLGGCACAALRGGGLAGFPAPLGHEQGEGFIGGILERATLQDGLVPLG